MNKFEKMYNPLGLRIPVRLLKKDALAFAKRQVAPEELILDGYATPVEDQGTKPYCAAYAASNFAESVLWRRNGYPQDIDPDPLYAYAKTIDGDPTGDGTFLECTLEALLVKGFFDKDTCRVRTIGGKFFGLGSGLEGVKLAIHRYGCCIAGFNITGEWFSPENAVVKGGGEPQGGHAVTLVGYDRDGVIVLNSWGSSYAHDGKVYLTNKAFGEQFIYGAVLTNCMNGLE